MNREPLFRGKRVDNDEWVYGYDEWVYGYLVEATNVITDKKATFIIEQDATYYTHGEFACSFEVKPETVGQFTNLTDKNGNKIFEGDIVYNGVFKAQVELMNGRFSPFGSDTFFADECEVIGNVYNNEVK